MDAIQLALLRPFAVNKVQHRKGPGGKELAYITARDVMDRLDEVFEPRMADQIRVYRWSHDLLPVV